MNQKLKGDNMKVVLAYSGGLDTSVILKWLQVEYNAEVITFCADVGQEEELDGLDKKAFATGASKSYIEDLQEEFAADFIFPMMQANAIYEGCYLLGTSIARPLIAKRMVEIAREHGAEAICHGATGKGNDQVRFELTAYALQPNIKIIAPWRNIEGNFPFKSRTSMMDYCTEHGIPVSVSHKKPYSMDRNLLHISFEGGILEDPWNEAPDDMRIMTNSLKDTPDEAEYMEISFEKGIPVAINGESLSAAGIM